MKVCAFCLGYSYRKIARPPAFRLEYTHHAAEDDGQYARSDRDPGQLEEKAGDQLPHNNGQHGGIQEPGRSLG
jgi:hypothetical protein